MTNSTITTADEIRTARPLAGGHASAVSWAAIIAGAAAAAALSVCLLILGAGLGLSAVSPWTSEGMGAKAFGVSTILWLTLTQLVASALGGYLAGRLRIKWADAQADEIYFRDSAHGFLSWAVAMITTATLLTSVIGSITNAGVQAGATVAGTAVAGGSALAAGGMAMSGSDSRSNSDNVSNALNYFLDSLFRVNKSTIPSTSTNTSGRNSTGNTQQDPSLALAEVSRIFMNAMRSDALPREDVQYVGQIVAQRTSLGQEEAEKRVTDIYARLQENLRDAESAAREAADKARKVSAYAALWLFVSLLVGAFIASLTAIYGGRQRDL